MVAIVLIVPIIVMVQTVKDAKKITMKILMDAALPVTVIQLVRNQRIRIKLRLFRFKNQLIS